MMIHSAGNRYFCIFSKVNNPWEMWGFIYGWGGIDIETRYCKHRTCMPCGTAYKPKIRAKCSCSSDHSQCWEKERSGL